MKDEPLRAVVYARQSLTSGDADDSLSLESQIHVCREHIAKQGWQLAGVYVEPDTRGWRTDRPQFMRMLDAFRQGRADIVCVFKLSRFARNLMHQETVLTEIADAGGELVSVTEPYMSTSPMLRQIMGAVNEQARRDQSDHLKAAFEERARRGLHHGYAPLGYVLNDDGTLSIDEPKAETIRLIYQWALEGHGTPEIIYRLNERGLPTTNGHQWHQRTVFRVLRNRVYAGDVMYRGDVVAHDAHPAIVDKTDWIRVQAIMERRRKVRRKALPSWADGFVYHACGSRMYVAAWGAEGSPNRWRFRCGKNYRQRKDRNEPRCDIGQKSMFADRVEREFIALLIDALSTIATPDAAYRYLEAKQDASADERKRERTRMERRIHDVQRQRERLLDLVLNGRLDDEMYAARDVELKAELARLRAEVDAVPEGPRQDALRATYTHLVAVSDALPIVAHNAPERLPALLHELDVRLIIGPAGVRLQFGETVAAFVDGSYGHL